MQLPVQRLDLGHAVRAIALLALIVGMTASFMLLFDPHVFPHALHGTPWPLFLILCPLSSGIVATWTWLELSIPRPPLQRLLNLLGILTAVAFFSTIFDGALDSYLRPEMITNRACLGVTFIDLK